MYSQQLLTAALLQVVRAMWDYIKANNLQNPKNKRKILLDEKLSTLFKSPLDMFSMNSQLSRHVYTLGKFTSSRDTAHVAYLKSGKVLRLPSFVIPPSPP